ncbi:MAG: hypothetical protein KDL87_05195, partial [Verrucomicrobiae bacterium]|nr:hypothetical protein [Verrucomicrobiae bacterium]
IDSWRHGHPWGSQIPEQWGRFSHWVVSHQMHWPILGASVGMAMSLPGRVQTFLEHGPPFVPIGIGCAMRVVVVLFGCFLIPAIIGNSARIVWSIWAVLVLSELGALWMHWDVQTRLRKKGIAL